MCANPSKKAKSIKGKIAGAPKNTVQSVLTGGIISSDFFYKHKLKLFVALVLIMFYISTKYQCMTGLETIRNLEKRLEVVKTEHIREQSRYMSRIRESSMAALADSIRPGLAVQQQPPFIIYLDNQ